MVDLGTESCSVREGWQVWQDLKGKYRFTNTCGLVVFPALDLAVNREAVAMLPSYMEQRHLQKVIVVTDRDDVADMVELAGHKDVSWEKISDEAMESLLRYYRLICFWLHIAVVSLEEPFGNDSVLCNGKADLRSYVYSSIYRDSRMGSVEERIRLAVEAFAAGYERGHVVIYGCTFYVGLIYRLLCGKGIFVEAIVDNDVKKAGSKYLGVDVFLPERYLRPFDGRKRIIVCSVHGEEMRQSLYGFGYGDENILYIDIGAVAGMDSLEDADKKMELVGRGMECCRKLRLQFGNEAMILVAPKASGDVFLACAYLRPWIEAYGIGDYVLVGTESNLIEIAELYGIRHRAGLISAEERESLLAACMFRGEELNIKALSGWELRIRNSYVREPASPFLFRDAFKCETYALTKGTEPVYPKRIVGIEEDKVSYMEKGRTVIIAPYAYSSQLPMIAMEIWEDIAKRLRLKGYMVCTVAYGKGEPPIKGTLGIQFPYREACGILEYAGGFIGARSGLCDIVHMAKCKMLIIYGKKKGSEYRNVFFGLKENYSDFKGEELIFDDYDTRTFVHHVENYF